MRRTLAGFLSATSLIAVIAKCLRRRRDCCDPAVGAWPNDATWDSDGQLSNADVFRSFVEDARPCWRHYPIASAMALIGIDPTADAPIELSVERAPSAGSGEVDVTLTQNVTGDDSVAAVRYRCTFVDEAYTGGEAGVFRLLEAVREFRCQPGRGQNDWGPQLCL